MFYLVVHFNHPTIKERLRILTNKPQASFLYHRHISYFLHQIYQKSPIHKICFSFTVNLLYLVILEPFSIFWLHHVNLAGTI